MIDVKLIQAIAALLGFLIAATGLVRMILRRGPDHALSQQVQAWWYLLPIASVACLLFPIGADVMALVILAFALFELAKHHRTPWRLSLACIGVWLCADLLARVETILFLRPSWILPTSWVLVTFATAFFAWRRVAKPATSAPMRANQNDQLLGVLAITATLGMATSTWFERLTTVPAQRWYFYLLVLTALNDVAQFVVGSVCGRSKILPMISPNKSWQGLLGGVLISMLMSCWLGQHLGLHAGQSLLNNPELAALGGVLALVGFCGDSLYSAGKRALGLKDYSSMIPGHGGVLDRTDSLILTAPALYLWLRHLAQASS